MAAITETAITIIIIRTRETVTKETKTTVEIINRKPCMNFNSCRALTDGGLASHYYEHTEIA